MNFWDFVWLLVMSFFFVAYLMILFMIFVDIFRDRQMGGWGKAGWCALVFIFPLLGSLIYLIVRGNSMARRQTEEAQERRVVQDEYIRSVAGAAPSSPAKQVAEAKALLDSGAISAQEYDAMKAKALA
ncbi:MAG TPA: SHOCT domain-containing protein [Kineosporiaceae bacterium]